MNDHDISLEVVLRSCQPLQGCILGLECLGLETVSRCFFERLGLVSIPSLQSLGLVSVSASYVSFT